jgi:hypothetical protein
MRFDREALSAGKLFSTKRRQLHGFFTSLDEVIWHPGDAE